MLIGPALAVLFLLGSSNTQSSPDPCRCVSLRPTGLRVDCRSRGLTELPPIPPTASELHLQDNRLHSLRPGMLDALLDLRMVNLSGNPWDCGCSILYLRAWLRDHEAAAGRPTCVTPAALRHRAIAELSETDLPSCSRESCVSGWLDIVTILLMAGLIALLFWCLWTVKNSTFTFNVVRRHGDVDKDLSRSFEAKRRKRSLRRRSEEAECTLQWTDDLEKPLFNMEILPQVLEILHKKHNIKIKAT
ncbi:hypothetical protein Z043_103639 [Scleropages formosus]|uniref:LRRCT domain-containing protein n=1 Tax=Scleropages formosus TaxID=113540 RepID=A0A0N8K278_SCLFO|nr:hypothetical protein Z043_103639 [Scleropages formosus]